MKNKKNEIVAEWKSQIATSNSLIVDNAELHNLGSSINCLGRRVATYTTRDPKEIAKVLAEI